MRLAIVDDNDGFRRFIRTTAEMEGWSAFEFEDGNQLIQHYDSAEAEVNFDLIVLDVFMRHRDAFDTMRFLAANHVQTPIVVVSGGGDMLHGDPALYLRAAGGVGKLENLNVISVLGKPVSLNDLRDILRMTVAAV
ncbi:MAG: response regulator [Pseudomonadota bacterium]